MEPELEVKSLDHLGLVAGIIDELGLVELTDVLLPRYQQNCISCGQVVKALLLNCFGFSSAPLYLFSEFFERQPVAHLLGEGIEARHYIEDIVLIAYKLAFRWLMIAFAIRILVCIAIHLYSLDTGFGGFYPLQSGHDDILYWDLAIQIQNGVFPDVLPSSYPLVLAALFSVTGQNLLLGKLLNVFIDSLTVFFAVLLSNELVRKDILIKKNRNRVANLTGLFLSLYPSTIFYSTQLIRDPLIVFLGIINLYLSVFALKTQKLAIWLFWCVSLLATYSLRPYAAASLVISFLLYLLLIWKTKLSRKLLVLLLAFIICALAPYFLGQGFFAINWIVQAANIDEISTQREVAYSTGGSSTGITIDYSNPISFIITYVPSFLTAIIGPFPWQLNGAALIALPEAFCMWGIQYKLWLSFSKKTDKFQIREEGLLLISALVSTATFSLFSDNIGANTRLRLLSWISLLVYSSVMFGKRKEVRKKRNIRFLAR